MFLFNIVLDFLFELVGRLGAFCKHDVCLNDLTSDLVGSGGDGTFKNIGQLHDDAFDLKRPDAVSGGLDDIIHAADIPVESILITPCNVAGMIISVVPDLFGLFLVFIVALEQSTGNLIGGFDDDLARFAVGNGISVAVEKGDIELGRGFAHRADLVGLTHKVGRWQGWFRSGRSPPLS